MPVIAVGRLGDPEVAAAAVAAGKADFIALGRTLIAEPDWVAKLARGEPARRCLACNTCINEMRGGAEHRLRRQCSGRSRRAVRRSAVRRRANASPSSGRDPPASPMPRWSPAANPVTVFEREAVAGGAFRYAGKAPMFQEVVADQALFDRYIDAHGRGLRAPGRDLPLRHGCLAGTKSCSRPSTAS